MMKLLFRTVLLLSLCAAPSFSADAKVLYENNFEKAEVGKVPADFLVLDGGFAVKESEGGKVLELPGSPLDSFGTLFGPNEKENLTVSARIFGTRKGRLYPTFSVGLNGAGGYKLQVSPGKKMLEIYRGDTHKTSVPFEWPSGKWTKLVLSVKRVKDGEWKIEGTAAPDGAEKVGISLTETEAPSSGRAYVGGSPYSTTPILFDDLVLTAH